jgi:hypothetical protein
MTPCPARTSAVLNFDQATIVRCGGVDGHPGPHYVSIEWGPDRCSSTFAPTGAPCELHEGHPEAHLAGMVQWGEY